MARMQDYDDNAEADHSYSGGGGLLPVGDYVGQIIESDVTANNNQTGQVLKLTWELLNDGYKGRRVWQNINIQHTASQKAHEIGQRELANLKDVLGIAKGTKIADSVMLHNIPAGLYVKVELGTDKPAGGKYPDKNQVSSFFFANEFGSEARKSGSTAAAAPAAAPAPYSAPASRQAANTSAPAPAPAPAAAAPVAPWLKKKAA